MLVTVNLEGLVVPGGLQVTIDEDKTVQDLINLFCESTNIDVSDDYIIANHKGDEHIGTLRIAEFHIENDETLYIISKRSLGPELFNFLNWQLIALSAFLIGICGISGCIYSHFFDVHTPDNYAIVFDAGSTHTEAILYKWAGEKRNNTGNVSQVDSCTIKRGISSIDVSNVSSYLSPCFTQISKMIPSESVDQTRVFFGATAGMRLLREQNPHLADSVMNQTRQFFSGSEFKVVDENIEIISGEVEALSGWISSNYLQHTFDSHNESWGALDLGGASTQMSFEVKEILSPNDTTTLELFGKEFKIVRKSFLCYGVEQAFKRYRAFILHEQSNGSKVEISSPCEPKGSQTFLTLDQLLNSPCLAQSLDKFNSTRENFTFIGTGNLSECQRVVKVVLSQDFCQKFNLTDCIDSTILTNHGKINFLAFSVYGHVMDDLSLGNHTSLEMYKMRAEHICSLALQNIWDLEIKRYTHLGLKIWTELCFDTQFVLTLLTDVYKFETEEKWGKIQFSTKLNETNVGWALGFALNKSKEIPSLGPVAQEGTTTFILLLILFVLFLGLAVGIFIKSMRLRICNNTYQRRLRRRRTSY